MGCIIDGTRDALLALKDEAKRHGFSFDPTKETHIARVGRRGEADDGGITGRLVLLTKKGRPARDRRGQEIAVRWCTTLGVTPRFRRLNN